MLFQDHIPLVWFCRVVEIASGVGVNMIFLLFDVNNLLNRFASGSFLFQDTNTQLNAVCVIITKYTELSCINQSLYKSW